MTSYLSEAEAVRLDGLIHQAVFTATGDLSSPKYYTLCREVRSLLERELANAESVAMEPVSKDAG